jgi:DNA repair exonuclease SbcCD nuclease subunit
MKFIHCSDLHLDSKIEGMPVEKSKTRREEVVRTFERLCEYAKSNGVTAVIIAGDMFDTARVTIKTKERVLACINACANVDFIYLPGNHDDVNFISDLESIPSNLKVVGDNWTCFNYGLVNVCGVTLTGANSKTIYDSLNLPQGNINVVAMHGQIIGHKGEGQAETISLPRLKEKNIDYLALGHIHSFVEGQLDLRGKYAYSGCLDGRGFDELGTKGFVLIEVENEKLSTQFVEFSSRIISEFDFNVEGYPNWFTAVTTLEGQLKKLFDRKCIIKVNLMGERKTDFYVDKDGLSYRLNEHFFFAKVKDKTTLKIQKEDYESDKSVRGEFVRAVIDSHVSEDRKKEIILLGLNALNGEEI